MLLCDYYSIQLKKPVLSVHGSAHSAVLGIYYLCHIMCVTMPAAVSVRGGSQSSRSSFAESPPTDMICASPLSGHHASASPSDVSCSRSSLAITEYCINC